MERRLASGNRRRPQDQVGRRRAGREPADRIGPRRRRRAGRPTRRHRRAGRRQRGRGTPEARRAPRRTDRAQGSAGRGGRGHRRQRHAVEVRRRPAARDPRRVAHGHGAGPQDRRRAVEAVLRRPRDVQPSPRLALRRAGPGARRHPAGQGGAVRARRAAGRLDRLGRDGRDVPRHADASGRPRAAPRRTSTTRCGAASRPPRTSSSRPAMRSTPSATPSSDDERDAQGGPARRGRGHRPVRRRRRPRGAARDRRQVGCRRQGAPRARSGTRPAHAGGREEDPRHRLGRPDRSGGAGPSGSVQGRAPSSTSCRPRRPRRPVAPRTPNRHGPAPRSGGSGPRRPSRRSARSARTRRAGFAGSAGPDRGSSSRALALLFQRPARRRSCSAASWTAVRDHTTRAQWNDSRITAIHAMISPMPGPGMRLGHRLTRPHRQHADRARHRRTGQRDPGQAPAAGESARGSRTRR